MMARAHFRPNLPAAILKDGDAGSDVTPRLVPGNAVELKVGGCVLGYFAKPKRKRRKPNLAALKARQVAELYHERFGQYGVLPDAQEGRPFAIAIAGLVPADAARVWIGRHCDAIRDAEIDAILADAAASMLLWSVSDLGDLLAVTLDERDRLKLTNLGVAGMSKAQRQRLRRERDRERKRTGRAATQAAEPRKVPLSVSKPWLAFGWSRRHWEKKGKPDPVALAQAEAANGGGSKYINSAADASCGIGGANRATKVARPSIEQSKPWEAEGVSRRTWYRRQQAAKAGNSERPRPIRQKAKVASKAKAKTLPAPAPIVLRDDARAVAARVAAISKHLEATARPLRALVRATSSFPLTAWRPNHAAHP